MIDVFNTSGVVDQTDLMSTSYPSTPSDATVPGSYLCSGARPTTLPLVCCK